MKSRKELIGTMKSLKMKKRKRKVKASEIKEILSKELRVAGESHKEQESILMTNYSTKLKAKS